MLQACFPSGLNGFQNQEWEELEFIVDSGSSDTVIGEESLPGVKLMQMPASQSGVEFECANGEWISNLGQKQFHAVTDENVRKTVTAQVCNVNKSLLSVSRVTRGGARVVFDSEGSYIEDKTSGEVIYLKEKNGMYMLRLWAKRGF